MKLKVRVNVQRALHWINITLQVHLRGMHCMHSFMASRTTSLGPAVEAKDSNSAKTYSFGAGTNGSSLSTIKPVTGQRSNNSLGLGSSSGLAQVKMAGEIRFAVPGNGNGLTSHSSRNNGVIMKKPRKLWTLQDRSAISVNLLKANLAEDGCAEAQLDVAKKLLADVDSESLQSKSETARLAIYWLIKSSEQGNSQATTLLKECLDSRKGITSQNILDVRTCLDTLTNEKLTFAAARALYAKLNNGEEFITTTQLHSRILCKKNLSPTSTNPADFPLTEDSSSDNESCQNDETPKADFYDGVLSGNSNRHRYTPNFSPNLANHEPSIQAGYVDSNTGILRGVKLTLEDLIETASTYNAGDIPTVSIDPNFDIPNKQAWSLLSVVSAFVLHMLLVALLVDAIGLSTGLTLASVYVILWSSHNLRLWCKRQGNFRDWTESFKTVLRENAWSEQSADSSMTKKWLRPYLIGCALSLLSFNVLPSTVFKVAFGTVMLVSICLARLTGQFRPGYRVLLLTCLPFIQHQIANLPVQLSGIMNFVGLDDIYSLIVELSEDMRALLPEYLTISVFFTSLQALIFLSLFFKKNTIVPELLTLLWFLTTTRCALELTIQELAFAGLLLVTFELVYFLLTTTTQHPCLKLTLLTTAVLLMISAALFSAAICYQNTIETSTKGFLLWDEYDINCHTKAWQSKSLSVAQTQIKCFMKYEDAQVNWSGIISLVKLVKVVRASTDSGGVQTAIFDILVNVMDASGATAADNGDSWNWLGFGNSGRKDFPSSVKVQISLESPDQVKQADDLTFIMNLRAEDKIQFTGKLLSNLGAPHPEIGSVKEIKCISCSDIVKDETIVFTGPTKFKFSNRHLNELCSHAELFYQKLEGYIEQLLIYLN